MSKYLVQKTEVYRCDTESEAVDMINKAKHNNSFDLKKYQSEYRERKVKGETADAWFKVTLTKVFNDEKEPIDTYEEDDE